ncbi:MAG TPA: hypothetical protein VFQ61_24080 [Polyangiaceae bacterium]|nr:hypothetical protein [Polyangiaceae bacterium]
MNHVDSFGHQTSVDRKIDSTIQGRAGENIGKPIANDVTNRVMQGSMALLSSRAAVWWIGTTAAVLSLTSIQPLRALDDWVIALAVSGRGGEVGLPRSAWDAFTFTRGDPAENAALRDAGLMLPWWADTQLRVAFFRPLAALSHALDERLWPNHPALMHVHSLVWLVLLVALMSRVYRRFADSSGLAGLALALYALDDARGATLAWLSNRNALMCAVFGCGALLAHDTWRQKRLAKAGIGAIALFLATWASGELAIGALAYLVAYALFVDRGSWRARATSLMPYLLLSLICVVTTRSAGFGVQRSGAYLEPWFDISAFLQQAFERWLWLAASQLGPVPSDLGWMLGPGAKSWLWLGAISVIGLFAWLLRPFLDDAKVRFWLCGGILSLLPMATTLPSDRLLTFVGIGASPLLARVLGPSLTGPSRRVRTALGYSFAAVHLILAPLLFPLRAAQMNWIASAEETAYASLGAPLPEAKTLILVNAPHVLVTNYIQARWSYLKASHPAHVHSLAATGSDVRVTRLGAQTLLVTPRSGYFDTPLERAYRSDFTALARAQSVRLTAFEAQVSSTTPDGRPRSIAFSFTRPLNEYLFACWVGGRFVPCDLPAIGRSAVFEADDLKVVVRSLTRNSEPDSKAREFEMKGSRIE